MARRPVPSAPDRERSPHVRTGESFITVLEVCGFNDWLIRALLINKVRNILRRPNPQ